MNRDGAFATQWEGWKNPRQRSHLVRGRLNISHADRMNEIEDAMGVYICFYEPTLGSPYVAYVGYSKKIGTELRIRCGGWDRDGRFLPRGIGAFPFAALYIPSERDSRAYEDDLIRYYCPPWNTKFHR